MAVMITVEAKGQTQQGYEGMRSVLAGVLQEREGFILHMAQPIEGGYRIVEVWETVEAANRFFSECVAPNVPQGVRFKRDVQQFHGLVAKHGA